MKRKILFGAMALFAFTGLKAQTILTEDFGNGLNGWTVENLGTSSEVWEVVPINPGFMTTGENGTIFAYGYDTDAQAVHDGNTIITSPRMSTSGYANVALKFEQIFDVIQGNSTCSILVSTDSTAWTTVYTNGAATGGVDVKRIDITAAAADADSLWLRYQFVSTADRYWIVDDIELYAPEEFDAALLSVSIAKYVAITSGDKNVTVDLMNMGSTTITEVEMSYTVNGGTPVVETISGLNIASLTNQTVTFPTKIPLTVEGVYDVDVVINTLNTVADGNSANNNTETQFIVYDEANSSARLPLYEVYTGSTCGPCKPGNEQFHSVVDGKPQDAFVMIKFQQDFPGAGDPYTTEESVDRRGYYGINSIPRMEIDGGWDKNASSFTNTLYNSSIAVPAVFDMQGEHFLDPANQAVEYNYTITPRFDMPDGVATLYIAIIEKLTTENAATNGETEFEHVMKKMIGGVDGTSLTGVMKNGDLTFSGTYVFPGNYRLPKSAADQIDVTSEHSVEEFDDLTIVAWVQYEGNKQVLQANNSEQGVGIDDVVNAARVENLNIFPNPADNFLTATFNLEERAEVEVRLTDLTGKVIKSKALTVSGGDIEIEFTTSELAAGNYLVSVYGNGQVLATKKAVVQH